MHGAKPCACSLAWLLLLLCSAGLSFAAASQQQPAFKRVLDALRAADASAGFEIVTISPKTSPSFPFVICHSGSCPCDVCGHIESVGLFAPVETSITSRYILTQEACVGRGGVVLDVGANVGYFTMLAAAAGCKVHAFEPNPAPRSLIHLNVIVNEMHGQVTVHAVAISAERTIGVMAGGGQWGYGSVQAASAASLSSSTFEMRPMSDFVHKDVLLLKVDTEGFELDVFEGAWGLLQNQSVSNVIVEIKEFNSEAKRKLMHRIMVTGQFRHVYNYAEAYSQRIDQFEGVHQGNTKLAAMIVNVTDIVRDNLGQPFHYEDFWFRKEQLSAGHFTPYTLPSKTT